VRHQRPRRSAPAIPPGVPKQRPRRNRHPHEKNNKKIRSEIPFQQKRKKSIIRHKNCKKMNQVYAFFRVKKKLSDVFRFGSSGLNSIAIAWLCLQVVLFPAVCCAFVL